MKKLKFFGLLVALALLAFGLTVGCSNGSTDEEVETQSSVFTGKTATGQDVEITFSNVAFAKARAAGPYQNGFYLLKIDGVEKSRGRTRLDSNKDITFIPDGGGTEFHGELLNGVLEVSGTVDGVALNVRTTTEDSGTTPGGVGGGGGSGTGGGARETAETPVISVDGEVVENKEEIEIEQEIGVTLILKATVAAVTEEGTVTTTAWYETAANYGISGKDPIPGSTSTGAGQKTYTVPEPDGVQEDDEVYYAFVATNAKEGKTSKSAQVNFKITYKEPEGPAQIEPVTGVTITGGAWVAKPDPAGDADATTFTILEWDVEPSNATNQTVVWSFKDDPAPAGVSFDPDTNGKIIVTLSAATGVVDLVATIVDGLDVGDPYTKNTGLSFTIAAFGTIPVPDIHLHNPSGVGSTEYVGDETTVTFTKPAGGPANTVIYYQINNGTSEIQISALVGSTEYITTNTVTIPDSPAEELVISAVVYDAAGNSGSGAFGTTWNLSITKAAVPAPTIARGTGFVTDGEAGGNKYVLDSPAPTITIAAGDDSPSGVALFYSIDGSAPSLPYTPGTTTVTLTAQTQTVANAKATKAGYKDGVATPVTFEQARVKTPSITLDEPITDAVDEDTYVVGTTKFIVESATSATVTYKYTLNSTPPLDDKSDGVDYTAGGVAFDGTTIGNGNQQTISAKAFKDGYLPSAGATETFDKAQVKAVDFDPDGGASGSPVDVDFTDVAGVKLSCDTNLAVIVYSFAKDDTDLALETPTSGTAGVDVTVPLATLESDATAVIKAKATKAGYQDSTEDTKYYAHDPG